jgi:hypothetical protein
VNEEHLRCCASAEWAETVERVLLPWAVGGRGPGDEMLEVDAGPGLVTDALRGRVPDVFLPADPAALPGRLRAAGFADPEVEVDAGGDRFRFAATRPGGARGSA